MKILTQQDCIHIESANNAPEISNITIENTNKIFKLIKNKFKKLSKKNKLYNNLGDYFHLKAIEKLELLNKKNYSKKDKVKKIFNYIHWYYINIAGDFNQEGLKISIPDIFRQILENPDIINDFEIIICGDNPGNKEYDNDRGFNPEAKAGSILNTILNTNSIQDKNVLFFNKTFISTTITNDLKKINNKKNVINSIEFNAKILNILSEILEKPVLVLGGQNEAIFKIFFKNILKKFHLAPHTSMYKIFGNNKNIIGWDEKFTVFKTKYQNYNIFSDGGYLSLKKLENLNEKEKYKIMKDYFMNVVLN